MNKTTLKNVIAQYDDHPLGLLELIDGYYECQKSSGGQRQTPLVGYAGKYDSPDGPKQYVGEIYVNFSKAEEYPDIMLHFAAKLYGKFMDRILVESEPRPNWNKIVCVGPQLGGFSIAQLFALQNQTELFRFACAEKKVVQAASSNMREQTELFFGRHEVPAGSEVVVIEDVLNNFSTTGDLIRLVESSGSKVIAIGGLLNRSDKVDDRYMHESRAIPVFSLVRKAFDQYRQDDPFVANDIARGNVVWKPKNQWEKLKIVGVAT